MLHNDNKKKKTSTTTCMSIETARNSISDRPINVQRCGGGKVWSPVEYKPTSSSRQAV